MFVRRSNSELNKFSKFLAIVLSDAFVGLKRPSVRGRTDPQRSNGFSTKSCNRFITQCFMAMVVAHWQSCGAIKEVRPSNPIDPTLRLAVGTVIQTTGGKICSKLTGRSYLIVNVSIHLVEITDQLTIIIRVYSKL